MHRSSSTTRASDEFFLNVSPPAKGPPAVASSPPTTSSPTLPRRRRPAAAPPSPPSTTSPCSSSSAGSSSGSSPNQWKIGKLCFEADSEPYAQIWDKLVMDFASMSDIEVFSPNGGKPPLGYQSFIMLVGQPPNPIEETISFLPPVGSFENSGVLSIPTIKELGYGETKQVEFSPFKGGESEALKRLRESLANEEWVANFQKPKGLLPF